jgi:hypothetical protein
MRQSISDFLHPVLDKNHQQYDSNLPSIQQKQYYRVVWCDGRSYDYPLLQLFFTCANGLLNRPEADNFKIVSCL